MRPLLLAALVASPVLAQLPVGSYRYRVSYKGPGGHSYGAFGIPNPIHALGRAIAAISDSQVPTNPKTTFNVGIIEGGTSVNSISASATMEVDMRSEDASSLAAIDVKVQKALPGAQADAAPIVQTALNAAKALGFTSSTQASSTDANLPISLGIPAIRMAGGGRGEGAHSLGESYADGPTGWLGPQWAALVVAALAGVR